MSQKRKTIEICELMSMPEIAALLDVKLSAVHSYRSRGLLPAPVAELGCGPIYRRSEIIAWAAERPGKGWRKHE